MLAIVGVLVGGGSATFVYELTKPPTLIVTDGSTTGVIEADFANVSSLSQYIRYFDATTYANGSQGLTSTLTLRLFTYTLVDVGGIVITNVFPIVEGRLASDLVLSGLTFTYNQTGQFTFANGWAQPRPANVTFSTGNVSLPGPTNVSYSPYPMATVSGPGSAVLSPTFLSRTGEAIPSTLSSPWSSMSTHPSATTSSSASGPP